MLKSLKLPFQFDAARIIAELEQFSKDAYYDIYNPSVTLETLWSIEFIVPKGTPDTEIVFLPNEALEKCPYLLSVFDMFKCRVETFRVHSLDAGASIRPHIDTGFSFEQGKIRLHVPIKTNDGVEILVEGERVKMEVGECWYCNFNMKHEVHNKGKEARVHLIIDCMVDDWLTGLFKETMN